MKLDGKPLIECCDMPRQIREHALKFVEPLVMQQTSNRNLASQLRETFNKTKSLTESTMGRFFGKVVIITGSSSGIGRSAALKFAAEGASVVIHGQNVEKLDAVHCEICSSGIPESKVLVIDGPIQNEKIQDKLVNETIKHFGRLDVLVNNAGISNKTGVDPNSLESFDFVFDVNVRAVYRLIQIAAPHLEKTKGAIVNISSGLSEKTYSRSMPYSISKAAINHLTRNFANLLSPKGIRVNCMAPGIVSTDFVARHGISKEQSDAVYDKVAKAVIPLQRISQPDEQADVILYLAASTTSYMTGSIVFNDGGLLSFSPNA